MAKPNNKVDGWLLDVLEAVEEFTDDIEDVAQLRPELSRLFETQRWKEVQHAAFAAREHLRSQEERSLEGEGERQIVSHTLDHTLARGRPRLSPDPDPDQSTDLISLSVSSLSSPDQDLK